MPVFFRRPISIVLFVLAAFALVALASGARAQVSPFTQALAQDAARDDAVAGFYKDRGYTEFWTGADAADRRAALFSVLAQASDQGLPVGRYDPEALMQAFRAAQTEGDRGRLEVAMSLALLDYARDVQTGILVPAKIDPTIVRDIAVRDRRGNLDAFATSDPLIFLHKLPPQAPEYAMLAKAKIGLETAVAAGGWGATIAAQKLEPGQDGPAVIALRDRMIAMGYLSASATATYDEALRRAVESFQTAHGLDADGVAGAGTLAEINIGPQARLQSVIVALERMRWINFDLGKRHIWVNQTDFTAKIVDDGKVTFSTRSVIGRQDFDRRTPEFSDLMEYMVVNPTWSVPRSITVKEYLPLMQRNPNAAGHLKLIDRSGRVVSRASVNFGAYTAKNFPYAMRQPPSDGNALGLVKFMFPNKWNIYLHDTPSKSLFANEIRAFSHGCVRLADPFDFAYALLGPQSADPKAEFQSHLRTKSESVIRLAEPVPVHLVYFTAFPTARGEMTYRRDIYGRDAAIFAALKAAGVVVADVQG